MLNINERNRVLGEDIHQAIESKNSNYAQWVKRVIDYADLQNGKDFFPVLLESTGGRPKTQYEFTLDAAKEICLLERNEKGKQIRRWLIEMSKKHETGLAFTREQISALMDICKSMTLVSLQKEVERKHRDLYAHPEPWWSYRAGLLGYSVESLTEALREVNHRYRNMREALVKLDAHELIRTGVIDLMICLGKTEEYAKNVGELCKDMSVKMELHTEIFDDTKPNPLGINAGSVRDKKASFGNVVERRVLQ